MDIQSLYDKLTSTDKLSIIESAFALDMRDLDALQTENRLDTRKVKELIFSYFLSGRIRVIGIKQISPPPSGTSSIVLEGRGDTLPFRGMLVRVEIHLVNSDENQQEFAILIQASGGNTTSAWTFAEGFPFYQNSLLSEIQFLVYEEPGFPNLYLASHDILEQSFGTGMFFFGLFDADSILGSNYRLFLGEESRDSYIGVQGSIYTSVLEIGDSSAIRPYISFFGALPEPTVPLKLGIFSLENIRYGITGFPEFNTATRQWQAYSYLTWLVDLIFTLPPQGKQQDQSIIHKIPIAAEIYNRDGKIRFRSNLEEGISLALEGLSGLFPGIEIALPSNDFKLQDYVKLTQLEIMVNPDSVATDLIEFVGLSIETNEEKNQWVIVDKLLVLQAIDFHILVSRPASSNRSIDFSLSGLIGIGEKGTLRLTTDFSRSDGKTYYSFHGGIAENSELNIKEVFAHFIGYEHPDLPNLKVGNFLISVEPPIKSYSGEIELYGNWEIPGIPNLFIEGLYFYLNHTGEAETSFVARAVFMLAGARLFVAADYESIEKGWTFEGGTYEDGIIPVGNWIAGLVGLFNLNPSPSLPAIIQGLELSNLGVRFNTRTKDFSFRGTARFPLDGNPQRSASQATLNIHLDLKQQPQQPGQQSQPAIEFGGLVTVLKREFALIFSKQNNNDLLVGIYNNPQGDTIALKELIQAISTNVAEAIPAGITISLKQAQLAIAKITSGSDYRFLFSVELNAGIQLSQLPIVGQQFTQEQNLSVIFHILAASADFSDTDVQTINLLTPTDTTKLPSPSINTSQEKVQIKAAVRLGGFTEQLALPITMNNAPSQNGNVSISPSPSSPSPGQSALIKWIKIQKTFGPFHFERLGVGFASGNIEFLLDASLMAAGLTLTLEGLGADCALTELSKGNFKPIFHLDGIGVDFKKTDLEIGGALLRKPTKDPNQYEYDGAVIIHYKKWEISAIGSYQTLSDGSPSLFVYALVNYPLGGPAFFFVEGLAAGFGYNRSLKLPSIDTVSTFPLIEQAISSSTGSGNPMQELDKLKPWITPAEGEYFLTVGVKFNSFKHINGFVLLTVMFGQHFEIDVLGLATLTIPNKDVDVGKPPLAKAQLSLLARFLPDEGFLGIQAKLTPDSHIFSEDCHLTGGFAYYCWFANAREHQNDFALTLGGYHPDFNVPAHYPQVPRLALNWQLRDDNVSIKADIYFATVPSALMVGGHLQINWQSGDFRAWFNAGLDCLVAWQPYHYDAHLSVAVGAAWGSWSIDVAADLHIWGPEFSGMAHISWYVISFDVTFGKGSPQTPEPLKQWQDFEKAFLPQHKNICTVSVKDGKVTNHGTQQKDAVQINQPDDLGVINPHHLYLAVHSVIPIRDQDKSESQLEIGIAPMGISANDKNQNYKNWSSSLTISVTKDGKNLNASFNQSPIYENVPSALWSASGKVDPKERSQEPQLVKNALCGYEIRPIFKADNLGEPHVHILGKDLHILPNLRLPEISLFAIDSSFKDETSRLQRMKNTAIAPETRVARESLLKALNLDTDVDWSGMTADMLRVPPQILQVL